MTATGDQTEQIGRRDVHAAARADHRAESPGPPRSASVAGVPGSRCPRLQRQRHLPEGPRRPCSSAPRRRRHLQVRAGQGGGRIPRFRLGVRVQLGPHRLAFAEGVAAPPFRHPPGLQPAGHLLAARAALAFSRRTFRLRPPRPEPRTVLLALRSASRARPEAAVPGAPLARAADVPARGSDHLDQRVVQGDRGGARRAPAGPRHRRAQWSRHAADAPDLPEGSAAHGWHRTRLLGHHGAAGRGGPGTPRHG